MEIQISERNAVAVISAEGELNALTSQDLAEGIAQSVRRCTNLVIDLTHVPYISSAGIHVLFAAIKACHHRDGDLRLAGLAKNVRRVLETSGFLSFAQAFTDVYSAFASFSNKTQV
jgi:anti-sigma B factor antagonist